MRGSTCAIVWISDELFMHIVGVVCGVCTRNKSFAHALSISFDSSFYSDCFHDYFSFIYLLSGTSSRTRQIGFKVENKIKYLHVFDTLAQTQRSINPEQALTCTTCKMQMHQTSDDKVNVFGRRARAGIIELIVFPLCGVCAPDAPRLFDTCKLVDTRRTCNALDWSSCYC